MQETSTQIPLVAFREGSSVRGKKLIAKGKLIQWT